MLHRYIFPLSSQIPVYFWLVVYITKVRGTSLHTYIIEGWHEKNFLPLIYVYTNICDTTMYVSDRPLPMVFNFCFRKRPFPMLPLYLLFLIKSDI